MTHGTEKRSGIHLFILILAVFFVLIISIQPTLFPRRFTGSEPFQWVNYTDAIVDTTAAATAAAANTSSCLCGGGWGRIIYSGKHGFVLINARNDTRRGGNVDLTEHILYITVFFRVILVQGSFSGVQQGGGVVVVLTEIYKKYTLNGCYTWYIFEYAKFNENVAKKKPDYPT